MTDKDEYMHAEIIERSTSCRSIESTVDEYIYLLSILNDQHFEPLAILSRKPMRTTNDAAERGGSVLLSCCVILLVLAKKNH